MVADSSFCHMSVLFYDNIQLFPSISVISYLSVMKRHRVSSTTLLLKLPKRGSVVLRSFSLDKILELLVLDTHFENIALPSSIALARPAFLCFVLCALCFVLCALIFD